ncbi:MAG: cytochrome c [Terriglobales bacterium]|jgi:cytochrome c6
MKLVSKKTVVFALLLSGLLSATSLLADDAAGTYKAKCAMCHGADGKGSPMGQKMGVHDFTSADTQKMSDADLSAAITNGKNKMPAYKDKLTPDDVKGLVAYIRTLGKK